MILTQDYKIPDDLMSVVDSMLFKPRALSQPKVLIYSASTLSRAHGVLRRNFNEDFIEGSLLKQLIGIFVAKPLQS